MSIRQILKIQPKIGNGGTQPKGDVGPKPPPNGKPVATQPIRQITFSERDYLTIEAEARLDGQSIGQWMRDAIQLYRFVRQHKRVGNRLFIRKGNYYYEVLDD